MPPVSSNIYRMASATTTTSTQRDRFLLHWLDQSRSHRILFLLELLDLDYDVKIYLRHPTTWRGPKELLDVHPSGKAPVLEITHHDGSEPLVLAESGLIIQYLVKTYDFHHILTPPLPRQQLAVDYYLHYAEGTLQPILMTLLINSVAKDVAPRGTKTLVKFVTKGLNNGYYTQEWFINMQYLEEKLEMEGTGYFVGDRLTAADVIMTFPIWENIFDNEEGVNQVLGRKINLFKEYPHLAAWSMMIKKHPVYSRITEMMEIKVEDYIRSNYKKRT